MIKQRVWAIEIRPYTVQSNNQVTTGDGTSFFVTSITGGGGYVAIRGIGEGKIAMDVSSGTWVEWARSYSFQELREKSKEAIERFGKDKVRIVEIHNIDMITLPNA